VGPVTWLALGVLGGTVAAATALSPPVAVLLLLLPLCVGALALGRRQVRVVRAGALAIGLLAGLLAVGGRRGGPVLRGPVSLEGVVVGTPVGGAADVWVHRVSLADAGVGRVRVRLSGRAPPPGTEILLFGHAREPWTSALPGAPDLTRGGRLAGVRTEVVSRTWQPIGRSGRQALPPGRHGGVLHALAWGDRTHVDPALVVRMRRTGTAHLLAISGFHVGLVAGAVALVLLVGARAIALVVSRGVPVGWVWLVGAGAGWAYAIVAGAPVGAVRASWMFAILAVMRLLGLRPQRLELLALVAACVVVAEPAIVLTPGFQLSFGAVLGIVQLMPDLLARRPRRWPRWLEPLWTSLSASLAASVGTLPAAAWWFQAVSWTSPVANLVAGPVVSFVLVPLAAVHALAPGMDGWVGPLTDVVVEGLSWVLAPADLDPLPLALGGVGAVALGLALVVRRRWAWLLAALILCVPGATPVRAGLRLTFADVGQGCAVLVEWPDGRTWLVDGGPRSEDVLHWLRRRGVDRLDVVVASIGREDHAAGLAAVVGALPVGELWVPAGARGDPELHEVVVAAVDAGVPVIPAPVADLGGEARSLLPDEADRSIVLALDDGVGGPLALLPSDLTTTGIEAVLDRLPRARLVAMPRHGGRDGSPAALVEATRPALVVVQAGRHSAHGHPHPDAVERWARAGARVYRTDRDGTVEVTLGRSEARVRTYRPDRGWRAHDAVPYGMEPWSEAGPDARTQAVGGASSGRHEPWAPTPAAP